MSYSASEEISSYLGGSQNMTSSQLQIFLSCSTLWTNIQRQRLQVVVLQKRMINMLVMYMKKRQTCLRFFQDLTNSKMYRLLEYIRSPYQFYRMFRVNLPVFLKVREVLYEENSELSGWMPEIELLLFLFWLSAGASNRKVSRLLNISTSTLEKICHNVSANFLKKLPSVVRFPQEKTNILGKGFMQIASNHIFGLVVGCLDTYHVEIISDDIQYLNNKGYLSVQVQAVCDYRGEFMNIAVGFPGSMLKSHILQCTPLYLESMMPPAGYVLLSGYGYPCLQEPVCIVPPFEESDDPIEQRFNLCHNRIHSVMKKIVGQMFDRWRRIFSKPLALPLEDVTNIIIACSMVHNICLECNDIWPKEASTLDVIIESENPPVAEGQIGGKQTRRQMADCLLSEDEVKVIKDDFTLYKI